MFETYRHSIVRLDGLSRMIAVRLEKKDGIKDTVKILKCPNILLQHKKKYNSFKKHSK